MQMHVMDTLPIHSAWFSRLTDNGFPRINPALESRPARDKKYRFYMKHPVKCMYLLFVGDYHRHIFKGNAAKFQRKIDIDTWTFFPQLKKIWILSGCLVFWSVPNFSLYTFKIFNFAKIFWTPTTFFDCLLAEDRT